MKFNNLTGERFGRLTVLSCEVKAHTDASGKQHSTKWRCVCDCGTETISHASTLLRGGALSCGCSRIKHGWKGTVEYSTIMNILKRCYRETSPDYKYYGAKGVTVFDGWIREPGDFCVYVMSNLGERPSEKHSIDRINTLEGYIPGNIRWATPAIQQNNKTSNRPIEFNGEVLNMNEWAKKLGITDAALFWRLDNWPLERALTTFK